MELPPFSGMAGALTVAVQPLGGCVVSDFARKRTAMRVRTLEKAPISQVGCNRGLARRPQRHACYQRTTFPLAALPDNVYLLTDEARIALGYSIFSTSNSQLMADSILPDMVTYTP